MRSYGNETDSNNHARVRTAVFSTVAFSLAIALGLPGQLVRAEEPQAGEIEGEIEEVVVVVGSRRQDRSAADSPVPVDVIGGDEFLAHGDTDLDALLAALVPSYNVSQEPISDAATLVRPATPARSARMPPRCC